MENSVEMEKQLYWLRSFSPIQGSDSVHTYYEIFCNWKEKLVRLNYVANEESYVEDFVKWLQWDIYVRVYDYRSELCTMSDALVMALLEEKMLLCEEACSEVTMQIEENNVSEETIEPLVEDLKCISIADEMCDPLAHVITIDTTNGGLTKLSKGSDCVLQQTKECLDEMGEWCQEYHAASGLMESVIGISIREREAEKQVGESVKTNVDKCIALLAGHSIYDGKALFATETMGSEVYNLFDEMPQTVTAMENEASKELKQSKLILKLLVVVLRTGKIMNIGFSGKEIFKNPYNYPDPHIAVEKLVFSINFKYVSWPYLLNLVIRVVYAHVDAYLTPFIKKYLPRSMIKFVRNRNMSTAFQHSNHYKDNFVVIVGIGIISDEDANNAVMVFEEIDHKYVSRYMFFGCNQLIQFAIEAVGVIIPTSLFDIDIDATASVCKFKIPIDALKVGSKSSFGAIQFEYQFEMVDDTLEYFSLDPGIAENIILQISVVIYLFAWDKLGHLMRRHADNRIQYETTVEKFDKIAKNVNNPKPNLKWYKMRSSSDCEMAWDHLMGNSFKLNKQIIEEGTNIYVFSSSFDIYSVFYERKRDVILEAPKANLHYVLEDAKGDFGAENESRNGEEVGFKMTLTQYPNVKRRIKLPEPKEKVKQVVEWYSYSLETCGRDNENLLSIVEYVAKVSQQFFMLSSVFSAESVRRNVGVGMTRLLSEHSNPKWDAEIGYETFRVYSNYLYTGKLMTSSTKNDYLVKNLLEQPLTRIKSMLDSDDLILVSGRCQIVKAALHVFSLMELVMLVHRKLINFVDKALVEDIIPIVFYAWIINGDSLFDVDVGGQTIVEARRLPSARASQVRTNKCLLAPHAEEIIQLHPCVSPHSRLVLLVSLGNRLIVIRTRGSNIVFAYDLPTTAWSCAWDLHDGNYIYVGSQNDMVLEFDMEQTESSLEAISGLASNSFHTLHNSLSYSSLGSVVCILAAYVLRSGGIVVSLGLKIVIAPIGYINCTGPKSRTQQKDFCLYGCYIIGKLCLGSRCWYVSFSHP